jgi:hypothetical protein
MYPTILPFENRGDVIRIWCQGEIGEIAQNTGGYRLNCRLSSDNKA